MKYKLSEEEILALYPLVSAQRIIEDFSQERTFTLSGFYKLYKRKELDVPSKAYKRLEASIIDKVCSQDASLTVNEVRGEVLMHVERHYQHEKDLIWKKIKDYEEDNADLRN